MGRPQTSSALLRATPTAFDFQQLTRKKVVDMNRILIIDGHLDMAFNALHHRLGTYVPADG